MSIHIPYHCRGKPVRLWKMAGVPDADAIRSHLEKLPPDQVASEKEKIREALEERVYEHRPHCGEDLTWICDEVEKDGKEHAICCPRCGNVIFMKRPKVSEIN